MRFPTSIWGIGRTKFLLSAFGVVVLACGAYFLYWGNTRFTKISACVSCHEIYVDYDEYKPAGGLSESLEDHKRSAPFEPEFFKVTVGCAECHAYPYEEYRESAHYENDHGIKAGCVGCHESHNLGQIFAWKFFYVNTGGTGESPFHAISNSLRDIPAWEDLRITMAKKVRKEMIEENSIKCKGCHKQKSKWFQKIKRHQAMGEKTCVECHFNIVHKDVKWANKKR